MKKLFKLIIIGILFGMTNYTLAQSLQQSTNIRESEYKSFYPKFIFPGPGDKGNMLIHNQSDFNLVIKSFPNTYEKDVIILWLGTNIDTAINSLIYLKKSIDDLPEKSHIDFSFEKSYSKKGYIIYTCPPRSTETEVHYAYRNNINNSIWFDISEFNYNILFQISSNAIVKYIEYLTKLKDND